MPYFDHFAETRGTAVGEAISRRMFEREFDFLRPHLSRGAASEILEIGPGHGELAALFWAAGYRNYDIVEPNDAMREKLVARGVRRSSSYLLPGFQEADATYDCIIMCDVFEHLNGAPEAQTCIAEAHRVLRPGGVFFILSPDYTDWEEDFFNCDFSHSNPTTVRRVVQMFRNAGFEPRAFRYLYGCLPGASGWLLSRMIKLITAGAASESSEFRLYKLRLTFLRRFMIVGQRAET
jgi:SAM-dependent methyltransferase